MQFEWDERKRRQTLEKHDVDLIYAAGIFDGKVLSRTDRRDYGLKHVSFRSAWWDLIASLWCTPSAMASSD